MDARMVRPTGACLLPLLILSACAARGDGRPILVVEDRVEAEVPSLLFGALLERASWGEPGPEGAVLPGGGTLRGEVLSALRQATPPLLRFPGGTDVDVMDWRDLVSDGHGPGTGRPLSTGHTGRQIGNAFGLAEFLDLCQQLPAQPLLCVKVLSAVTGHETEAEVAQQAAALAAYCNAPLDADLSEDLRRYPALRAAHGRREPWNVTWFQIGNETWMQVEGRLRNPDGTYPPGLAQRHRSAVLAVARALQGVDPRIRLITDGPRHRGEQVLMALARDPEARRRIALLSDHTYAPGGVDGWKPPAGFDDDAHWWTWTAMPGQHDDRGQNVARRREYALFAELGYGAAATEWNWNGWGFGRLAPPPGFAMEQAAGLGAAAFLQGLLRESPRLHLATQSMLLGQAWGLAAIRYDPAGTRPPRHTPTGIVRALLARHHGSRRLRSVLHDVPVRPQPHAIRWAEAQAAVAVIDALATADEDSLYLHAINRDPHQAQTLRLDLPPAWRPATSVRRLTWQASLDPAPPSVTDLDQAWSVTALDPATDAVDLPPRSVSVIIWERRR